MKKYLLNIKREEMDPEKKAFLDEFDKIIEKSRLEEVRDLQKQIGYLDVNDLLKCFTI